MKRYLLALPLLLTGPAAFAQAASSPSPSLPVDPQTRRIAYSGSIAVPNVSQHDLYIRSKAWFTTAFGAGRRILVVDDNEAGALAGQGGFATNITYGLVIPLPNRVTIRYTIKLSAQPGSYAYYLTDFQFEGGQPESVVDVLDPTPGLLSLLRNPAVEPVCLARHPDGTLTRRAAKFSKVLDEHMQRLVASLQAGLSQAAGDKDW